MRLTAEEIIAITAAGNSVSISPDGSIVISPLALARRPLTEAERSQAYRDRKASRRVTENVTPPGEASRNVTDNVTNVTLPSPPPSPSPTPPTPPAPTPVRETRSRMREPEPDSVRTLESVIAAYPKNGNAMEARRALALLNLTVPELQAIREKTAVLADRMLALPESERRYCPAKHTFFQERRWEDDPGGTPWTVAAPNPAASPPPAPSKPYHNKWKSLNRS